MKAIPTILATLMVTTGVTSALLSGSARAMAWPDIEAVHGQQWDGLHANIKNQYMNIWQINPASNTVEGMFMSPLGWQTKKVEFYRRDFRKGVTEREIDTAIDTLGTEAGAERAILMAKGEEAKPNWLSFADVKGWNFAENLPDQMYYVITFDRVETTSEGNVWVGDDHTVRGKLDYRNCVHALEYNAATMSCGRSDSLADGDEYTYFPVVTETGAPVALTGQPTQSWEDEWQEVQKKETEAANPGPKDEPKDEPKVDPETPVDEKAELANKLAAATEKNQELQGKLDAAEAQKRELQGKLAEAAEKLATAEQTLTEVKAENEALKAQLMALKANQGTTEVNQGALTPNQGILRLDQGATPAQNDPVSVVEAPQALQNLEQPIDATPAQTAPNEAATSVTTPNLGRVETGNGWIAPLLGAVTLTGGLGAIKIAKSKRRH